jgi:hypothetical protein
MRAGLIVDFYDDAHAQILMEDESMIEKVGYIKPMTPEEREQLKDSDCALVILKQSGEKAYKFHVNSKDNTVMSQAYFDKTADYIPPHARSVAAYFIDRACDKWDVDKCELVKEQAEKFDGSSNLVLDREFDEYEPPVEKKASLELNLRDLKDEDFAWVHKTASQTVRKYPVADKRLTSASIYHYANSLNEDFNEGEHLRISKVLAKKAEEHGVLDGLDKEVDTIKKLAQAGSNLNMLAYIQVRKGMTEDESQRNALDSLWEKRAELIEQGHDPAELIAEFDKNHGFDKFYDRGLASPMETAYQYEKVASGPGTSIEILSKIADNIDQMSGIMESDVIDAFKEDPSKAFDSLSPAAKDMLITAAKQGAFS